MCKLVLNVGDKVRNINKRSMYKGQTAVVIHETKDMYFIRYQQEQTEAGYLKSNAHNHLEKVETPTHQCKCTR